MRTRPLFVLTLVAVLAVTLIPSTPLPAVASSSVQTNSSPRPTPSPVPNVTVIDSSETAQWEYVGSWTHLDSTTGSHGGKEALASAPGARATVQFFGTSVEILGNKLPVGGKWRITLDCETVVTGDSYAPVPLSKQVLTKFDSLPDGIHTVVVEVLGDHAWPSAGNIVSVDAASVVPSTGSGDAFTPYVGTAADFTDAAVVLRRPGCGTASSLLEGLKARTSSGQFMVPGFEGLLGRVNTHALTREQHPSAFGALTVAGAPREGASIPLLDGQSVGLSLSLPDRPRSLMVSLAADEAVGRPVQVAVVDAAGEFVPFVTVDLDSVVTKHEGDLATLLPRQEYTVVADLRGGQGIGAHESVRVLLVPMDGSPAEVTVLGGRTTDVAFERVADQITPGLRVSSDPNRLAAPASAFLYGPVVLSRVVADANRTGWTGDQSTPVDAPTTAVPLHLGRTATGSRPTVNGTVLPVDTISVQLPPSESGTSSVYMKLDTQQQCRSFTGSVGIDDATTDRSTASVSVGVFGDGEAMSLSHNGSWTNHPRTGVANPVTNGFAREELAKQLRDLKLAWAGRSGADAGTMTALTALVKADYDARVLMKTDSSTASMTFPLPNPVTLGAGSTVSSSAPTSFQEPRWERFSVPGSPHTHYSAQPTVTPAPVSATGMLPVAADLVTSSGMQRLIDSATRVLAGSGQIESALPRIVHLVISGTPGAIVDLAGAGLDCVSAQPGADGSPAPRAMPKYSQLGVPPLFLPAPRDAENTVLTALAANPIWWDLACPNGPTTDGMQFTATRERTTEYVTVKANHYWTIDTAKASKPACGFPADQLADDYGAYEHTKTLGEPGADHDNIYVNTTYTDSVGAQVESIQKDWTYGHAKWFDKVISWMSDLVQEVEDDPVTTMIWLALLPIDLPGAIVFNPFTMHALPMPAQVALGVAMMNPSMAENAAVKAIPAASGLSIAAGRSFEPANELLLLSKAQATGARLAILKIGDEYFAFSLKADIADARVMTETTPTIGSDQVTALQEVTNTHTPTDTDLGSEARTMCTRVLDGSCGAAPAPDGEPAPDPGGEPAPHAPDSFEQVGHIPPMPVPGHVWTWDMQRWRLWPLSFADRYAHAEGVEIGLTVARSGAAHNVAMNATNLMASGTPGAAFNARNVFIAPLGVPEDFTHYIVEKATDNARLFHFTSGSPEWFFTHGIGPTQEMVDLMLSLNAREQLNLAASSTSAAFVSLSRDADMLGAGYNGNWEYAAHWRFTVARPFGQGGGFEMRTTYVTSLQSYPEILDDDMAAVIANQAEVVTLSVRPELIEGAHYMQLNEVTGRFEEAGWWANPRFDVKLAYGPDAVAPPPFTQWERSGASVVTPNSDGWPYHEWALFEFPTGERVPVGPWNEQLSAPIVAPTSQDIAKVQSTTWGKLVWTPGAGRWIVYRTDLWGTTDYFLASSSFVKGAFQEHPSVPVWIPAGTHPEGFTPAQQPHTRSEWPTGPISITAASGALTETGASYRNMGEVHVVGTSTATGQPGVLWRLEPNADGTFRIINETHGTALHATGNPYDYAPDTGALNVVASPASWNSAEQRWTLTQNADGSVIITSVAYPTLSLESDESACEACGPDHGAVAAVPGDDPTLTWRRWAFVSLDHG